MEIFNIPSIVNEIQRSKLEWADHICRKQGSMVQRVFQENLRSKRPLGRPMLRSEDGIKKYFLNTKGVGYVDMDWKEAKKKIEMNGEDLFYGNMVSNALKKKKD
jgi:hypothetical protein